MIVDLQIHEKQSYLMWDTPVDLTDRGCRLDLKQIGVAIGETIRDGKTVIEE